MDRRVVITPSVFKIKNTLDKTLYEDFKQWLSEEKLREFGIKELTEIQMSWARDILVNIPLKKGVVVPAFTGYGKTTLLMVLTKYLYEKGFKVLYLTQSAVRRQVESKISSYATVINPQKLTGLYNKIKNKGYDELTDEEKALLETVYDFIILDDVESAISIDADKRPSFYKLFVFVKSSASLPAPKEVVFETLDELLNEDQKKIVKEYGLTNERNDVFRRKVVTEIKSGNKLYDLFLDYVKNGNNEIFRALRNISLIMDRVNQAAENLISDNRINQFVGSLELYYIYSTEWFNDVINNYYLEGKPKRVVLSSATFNYSNNLWAFILGIRGEASIRGNLTQMFQTRAVEIFKIKDKDITNIDHALDVIKRIYETLGKTTNLLVYVDTTLPYSVDDLVKAGNEKDIGVIFLKVVSGDKEEIKRKNDGLIEVTVPWLLNNLPDVGTSDKYYVLVGSSTPNSPLVRGLDLPRKVPVAVFLRFPSQKREVSIPSDIDAFKGMLICAWRNRFGNNKIIKSLVTSLSSVCNADCIEQISKAINLEEIAINYIRYLSLGRVPEMIQKDDVDLANEFAVLSGEIWKSCKDEDYVNAYDKFREFFEKVAEVLDEEELSNEILSKLEKKYEYFEKIEEILERIVELFKPVIQKYGGRNLERYIPMFNIFIQASGRTSRLVGIEGNKVKFNKGIAIILEDRDEIFNKIFI